VLRIGRLPARRRAGESWRGTGDDLPFPAMPVRVPRHV